MVKYWHETSSAVNDAVVETKSSQKPYIATAPVNEKLSAVDDAIIQTKSSIKPHTPAPVNPTIVDVPKSTPMATSISELKTNQTIDILTVMDTKNVSTLAVEYQETEQQTVMQINQEQKVPNVIAKCRAGDLGMTLKQTGICAANLYHQKLHKRQ